LHWRVWEHRTFTHDLVDGSGAFVGALVG
jgi:hypothetical protein